MSASFPADSRSLTHRTLALGVEELASRDADLRAIVRRIGPPPMWGRRPGFPALVRIILEQQVSLSAARTMYRRLERQMGGMHPDRVHRLEIDGLRRIGLTRQKARYCHELAGRILDGRLRLALIGRAPDEIGRATLLEVPGLGPWSIDIYYLMALRRPDVWPSGDLALADAMREAKGLPARPDAATQQAIAGSWRPWRSVAARILWHHYLSRRR